MIRVRAGTLFIHSNSEKRGFGLFFFAFGPSRDFKRFMDVCSVVFCVFFSDIVLLLFLLQYFCDFFLC